jgi:hypothetical protein
MQRPVRHVVEVKQCALHVAGGLETWCRKYCEKKGVRLSGSRTPNPTKQNLRAVSYGLWRFSPRFRGRDGVDLQMDALLCAQFRSARHNRAAQSCVHLQIGAITRIKTRQWRGPFMRHSAEVFDY